VTRRWRAIVVPRVRVIANLTGVLDGDPVFWNARRS
jgi:hypothetical protein